MASIIHALYPPFHIAATPHRIVPVRFARAVTGFADASAPDLDDHGFTLCDGGGAHGPTVGVIRGRVILGETTSGPEVRVQVIRDHLDDEAPIFATSENEALVQLTFPSPGDPLDPVGTSDASRGGDIIAFQSTSTSTASTPEDCKIFLHFGTVSGPVIAEMMIRVYPSLIVLVQPHRVTINGVGPDTTLDLGKINRVFNRINAIYAQTGIQFVVTQNLIEDSLPLPGSDPFAHTGAVTLGNVDDPAGDVFFETASVLSNFVRRQLNVYICKHLGLSSQDDLVGFGSSRAFATDHLHDRRLVGLLVRDTEEQVMALDSAHEIGHVLGLKHYGGGEAKDKNVREDIWAHRDLMYPADGVKPVSPIAGNVFHSSEARTHIGYGTLNGTAILGQLLATKLRPGIPQSNQITILIQSVNSGDHLP